MNTSNLPKVIPGINSQLHKTHFFPDEWQIIKNLSRELYVTSGGGQFTQQITLGKSSIYRYFLIKPTDPYVNMFNLEREIIVLFSPYETFEPRTLDAIDRATKIYQQLRLERIVSVLISKDPQIEDKIRRLLATERETQIVVPFTYKELQGTYDDYFVSNRFRDHFYNRDLFAYEAPLRRDIYFFGRTSLIQDIVNRYKSNENSGLFGLRKTGKTSVINAVTRVLDRELLPSVVIDCQDPAFHQREWNHALYYISSKCKEKIGVTNDLVSEDQYTTRNSPIVFESEIKKMCGKNGRLLIIFDEIENITHGIAASENWRSGFDFVYLWQTLRTLCQKEGNLINFLIVGTNPRCIEEPRFKDIDNPIFNLVPFQYIPRFEYTETKEMVEQLGKIMGLRFDEAICVKLTEDYGGHPYLIRHVCSVIHRNVNKKRPVVIGKTEYDKGKEKFDRENSRYITMILEILHKFYSDEYEMLKYLALGDTKTFYDLASISPNYTTHLVGYGIVQKESDEYVLKVESVRKHLTSLNKYKSLNLTPAEMLAEISSRRNELEPKLRFIIRTQLAARFGINKSYDLVMDVLDKERKTKLRALSYAELFDPNKSIIYFAHITRIIINNWDCFKNIFDLTKSDFEYKMNMINKYRKDAHAARLNENEMALFRACIKDIAELTKNYTE